MIDLYNYLLSRGFEKSRNKSINKYLTSEIYIKISPQNGNWSVDEYLYIYIVSKNFALLMTDLFKDKDSLAWSYLPRKLRKDSDGCLGMVMVGINLDAESVGSSTLISHEQPISIESFLGRLESMKGDEDIFRDLYNGTLGKLLALIEGMWVYLYFARTLGFSVAKTLSDVENEAVLKNHKQKWHLKRDMDADVVKLFNDFYDRIIKI